MEFALGENTRVRPDLAVVLGEDWLNLDRKKVPIPRPPAVAIEVISPSERTADSTRKVRIYLDRGVQEVWQAFPEDRLLFSFIPKVPLLPPTQNKTSSPRHSFPAGLSL